MTRQRTFCLGLQKIASVPIEQAGEVLEQTKRWMVYLLSEDVRLMQELQRTLLRKASVSVKVLPDPPKGSDAEKLLDKAEASGSGASAMLGQWEAPKLQLRALNQP